MKQTLILDISSDEEVGFDDSSTADNFDWISKLLEDSPRGDDVSYSKDDVANNGGHDDDDDDDSDDVVVVGEVLAKPKRAKISAPNYRNLGFDYDDDDCVVLNCDPDKPEERETVEEVKGSDDDSDDLLIVGEKGQVACRDYPHSRHLCAKFPFGSTPHESHCNLCHCYVCDTLAPCSFWGSGVSGLDHCCATDKSEYWQTERRRIRQLKNPSAPIAKPASGTLSRLPRLPQISSQPTPVLNPASTCGVPSSFGLPNIISQGRNQRLNFTLQRKRFQSPEVVGQLLRSCNSTRQSLRTPSLAPSLVSSRTLFKRPGFTGRSRLVNPSVYVPPNNASSVSYWQQLLNHPLVGKPTENNSINLTESSSPRLDINISSSLPRVSSISSGTLPSPMQGYNSPVSLTPTSHFQGYRQSNVVRSDNPWVYSSGSQTQDDSSPVFHCSTSNALNSVTQSSQQSSGLIQDGCGPNLPPCNSSDVLSSITPRIPQPSEATQNISSSDFLYNTSDSMNDIAQNYQHHSVEENPQVQGAVPGNGFLSSIEHNDKVMSGAMDSSALDFDLDCWLPENDPILDAQDGSGLYHMDNQPSVPPAVDAGMLYFDFETSWKGLAH